MLKLLCNHQVLLLWVLVELKVKVELLRLLNKLSIHNFLNLQSMELLV